MHILLTILGYGTAIFSACFILVFTSILFDEDEEDTSGTIAAIAILTGTLAVGAYMVRVSQHQRDEKHEKQILQLAAEEGAMLSNLNVEASRKILDDLCLQGTAQLQVTAEGVMEYVFSGLTAPESLSKPDTP